MDIDPVLISSVSRNLSISQNTKRVQKRKVEDELATLTALSKKYHERWRRRIFHWLGILFLILFVWKIICESVKAWWNEVSYSC